MIGDRAGNGRHGRNEHAAVRPHGADHARGDRAGNLGRGGAHGRAQDRQLRDQPVEQAVERLCRLAIGCRHLVRRAERLDDQIDGAVLEMQPAPVGQERDLHAGTHGSFPVSMGQGLSSRQEVIFIRSPSATSPRSRIESMCPPSSR